MSAAATVPNQFIRAFSLQVANQTLATEISNLQQETLHCKFEVMQNDLETPNIALITIYNLADSTAKTIMKEYDTVILNAGYKNGNFATIFKGSIKQFKRGRERNVDNYLTLHAADGDFAYNFGIINQTLPANSSPLQEMQALATAMGVPLDPNAAQALTGGVILNPRSKVSFGLARTYMRDLAVTHNFRWSILNGVLTLIPLDGYLPGDAVQVNSQTGMIGVPEATDDGIHIQMLLNPLLKVGGQVQINNADITQATPEQFGLNFSRPPVPLATVTNDGFYRILVIEHRGDTRGQDWYSEVICLNLTAPGGIVLPFSKG